MKLQGTQNIENNPGKEESNSTYVSLFQNLLQSNDNQYRNKSGFKMVA